MEVVLEDGSVGLGGCSIDIVVEEVNYRVEVCSGAAGHDLDLEVVWPSDGEAARGLGEEGGGGRDECRKNDSDCAEERERGCCTQGIKEQV